MRSDCVSHNTGGGAHRRNSDRSSTTCDTDTCNVGQSDVTWVVDGHACTVTAT